MIEDIHSIEHKSPDPEHERRNVAMVLWDGYFGAFIGRDTIKRPTMETTLDELKAEAEDAAEYLLVLLCDIAAYDSADSFDFTRKLDELMMRLMAVRGAFLEDFERLYWSMRVDEE